MVLRDFIRDNNRGEISTFVTSCLFNSLNGIQYVCLIPLRSEIGPQPKVTDTRIDNPIPQTEKSNSSLYKTKDKNIEEKLKEKVSEKVKVSETRKTVNMVIRSERLPLRKTLCNNPL